MSFILLGWCFDKKNGPLAGAIAAAGYRNKLYPYWISKTKDILLLWDLSKESHRIHFWNNLQTEQRISNIKSISSNLFIVESSKTFLLTLTHDVQNFFHQQCNSTSFFRFSSYCNPPPEKSSWAFSYVKESGADIQNDTMTHRDMHFIAQQWQQL